MTDRATASTTGEHPLPCLRTPTDLIDAVPYILGFHPAQSLVVVLLRGIPSRVAVTMRYDLPHPGLEEAVSRDVARHASAHGAERVVLIVFSTTLPAGQAPPESLLVSKVRDALRLTHLEVADALHVSGRRWRSYLCGDPRCCPPEGRPLPARTPRSAPTPAHDRAALARTLGAAEGEARAEMECALAEAEAAFIRAAASTGGVPAWRATMRRRVQSAIDRTVSSRPGSRPVTTTDEAAELLVGLSDPAIRDHCWLGVERGASGDGLALWAELVRRAIPPYDAPPLFLLAWAAWRRGDGVLARMAAERALRSDRAYVAAHLLLEAIDAGLDPRTLPDLRPNPGAGDEGAGAP
jgi:Domain of unknown function (DUF4192)